MNHASLFSGIGGFDLAAREVGWNNVFQCEIDPFCQSVLKYYFPKTVLYEDIKRTDFTSWKGKIDVLTGGFPCQPFSVAGQRKGADDNRYLWPEMLRVIRETRPLWVIGENVAGITNMVQPGSETDVETKSDQDEENYKETILEQEYIINTICDDLEREGYSVQPIIVPACGVGAPHKRYRVWFIETMDYDERAMRNHDKMAYLKENKVYLNDIWKCIDKDNRFTPIKQLLGYYYYVEVYKYQNIDMVSESANLVKLYEQKQIANDVVFEMIFHPNGNLNGSWVDDEDILLAYENRRTDNSIFSREQKR